MYSRTFVKRARVRPVHTPTSISWACGPLPKINPMQAPARRKDAGKMQIGSPNSAVHCHTSRHDHRNLKNQNAHQERERTWPWPSEWSEGQPRLTAGWHQMSASMSGTSSQTRELRTLTKGHLRQKRINELTEPVAIALVQVHKKAGSSYVISSSICTRLRSRIETHRSFESRTPYLWLEPRLVTMVPSKPFRALLERPNRRTLLPTSSNFSPPMALQVVEQAVSSSMQRLQMTRANCDLATIRQKHTIPSWRKKRSNGASLSVHADSLEAPEKNPFTSRVHRFLVLHLALLTGTNFMLHQAWPRGIPIYLQFCEVCLACKHLHAMFQQLVVKTRPLIKLALGKAFLAFVHRHAQGLWRIWSRRQNLIGKEQVALQRQLHRWATRRAGRGCAPGLPWLRTGPIMKARPLAWHAPMQSHGDVEWQPSLPQKPLPQVGIGHRDNDVRRINTERHGKNRHPTETKEPERPKMQQSGGSRAPERRGHQRVTNEPSRKQEHKTQASARNQKTRAVAWVAKPPEAKKNRHFHKLLSHQKDCGQMGNNTLLKPSVAWQVHWFSKSNTTWRQRGTGQRNENNGAKPNVGPKRTLELLEPSCLPAQRGGSSQG